MKDSDWETLAQCRAIARLCALFEACRGEPAWKAIREAYCLSRVDHVRKIRDRKQRTGIGKYFFVNSTIKNWNQLPAETLGNFTCKPETFRNSVRKTIIDGGGEMKGIEVWRKSSESAVQCSEVR